MKVWFQSKTNWFNIIVTVIGLITYLQSVQSFEKYSVWFGIVLVLGNLILRNFFTSTAIGTPPVETPPPAAPIAGQ